MAKKKASVTKVPVSRRALIQRINRALAHENQVLKKARQWTSQTGDYYIVDFHRNFLVSGNIEPSDLGRELGVLQDYEAVVD